MLNRRLCGFAVVAAALLVPLSYRLSPPLGDQTIVMDVVGDRSLFGSTSDPSVVKLHNLFESLPTNPALQGVNGVWDSCKKSSSLEARTMALFGLEATVHAQGPCNRRDCHGSPIFGCSLTVLELPCGLDCPPSSGGMTYLAWYYDPYAVGKGIFEIGSGKCDDVGCGCNVNACNCMGE